MTTKKRTLLDIGDDMIALEEILTEVGGDVTDAQADEAIEAWFKEVGGDLEKKLDGYASLITEMLARSAARKAEADRMKALAYADANAADRLKKRIDLFFTDRKIKKVETDRFKITQCKNGGSLSMEMDVFEATKWPKDYQVTTITVDMEKVKAEIKARELKDGQSLCFGKGDDEKNYITLGHRGTHVRIK